MRKCTPLFLVSFFCICACNFHRPGNVHWKEQWSEYNIRLKALANNIMTHPGKYKSGLNDFPKEFGFPFNEGYYIQFSSNDSTAGNKTGAPLTVLFYTDQDFNHYSAFIYTNNPVRRAEYDNNVTKHENNHKLEDNWYVIND